jgi:beta-lactam-binding protein with PASTA domain
MDVGQAQAAMQAAGLQPAVQVIPSELAPGTVISTNPGPGTPVAPGSAVTVTISGGLNPGEDQGFGQGDRSGRGRGND